ncbi:MAG: hypothetical protein J5I94_09655 [Phaeodactylibacter sp.]|nr:hypothetical protein [Phaeodactylibacter sp.]
MKTLKTILTISILLMLFSCQKETQLPAGETDEAVEIRQDAEALLAIIDGLEAIVLEQVNSGALEGNAQGLLAKLAQARRKALEGNADVAENILYHAFFNQISSFYRNGLLPLYAYTDMVNVLEQKGIFTDPRDGQEYGWVLLADGKRWMRDNLKYSTLTSVVHQEADEETFGRLYTWGDALTACPPGWHLPSYDEWYEMGLFYSYNENTTEPSAALAYDALVSPEYGTGGYSGFDALLGGWLRDNGVYDGFNESGHYWSSTPYDDTDAWYAFFYQQNGEVYPVHVRKSYWMSCRCVED